MDVLHGYAGLKRKRGINNVVIQTTICPMPGCQGVEAEARDGGKIRGSLISLDCLLQMVRTVPPREESALKAAGDGEGALGVFAVGREQVSALRVDVHRALVEEVLVRKRNAELSYIASGAVVEGFAGRSLRGCCEGGEGGRTEGKLSVRSEQLFGLCSVCVHEDLDLVGGADLRAKDKVNDRRMSEPVASGERVTVFISIGKVYRPDLDGARDLEVLVDDGDLVKVRRCAVPFGVLRGGLHRAVGCGSELTYAQHHRCNGRERRVSHIGLGGNRLVLPDRVMNRNAEKSESKNGLESVVTRNEVHPSPAI